MKYFNNFSILRKDTPINRIIEKKIKTMLTCLQKLRRLKSIPDVESKPLKNMFITESEETKPGQNEWQQLIA